MYTEVSHPPLFSAKKLPYDQLLNPSQLEAVMTEDGPALVIAGAGSGKTRTLVYRVARLVESGNPPESILLLTFTCKSAREMLERASGLLSERCRRVVGGTFHSVANQMLRKFSHHIGYPNNFSILDRSDSADAIGLLKVGLGLDKNDRHFPKKNTLIEIFSKVTNKRVDLEGILEGEYAHFLDRLDMIKELFRLYREYKERHYLMDYDDLLVKWKMILEENSQVREMVSNRFRYIMVDEYQDTNSLQADIVRLMGIAHNNVMVVGDDSQSIYSFRGANFRNILDFPRLYPGTRIIKLEENYRSTQPILSLANSVIARAQEKYTKCLYTRKAGGVRARLISVPDDILQSRFICEQIAKLRKEVPLSEMAVLFRASFHSFDLELALAKAEIPFVKIGGLKLTEAAHIKDFLAHLRVAANAFDLLSWNRILLLVNRIGSKSAQRILEWLQSNRISINRLGECPFKVAREEGFQALAETLAETIELADQPEECIARLLYYYEPVLRRVYPDDYPKRTKELEQLAALGARYDSIQNFLADIVLEPPENHLPVEQERGDVLTLSTIHSAKGLEWHSVFVISLSEGRFPSAYCDLADALEEERRLLYVAVTRAKENLFLLYPTSVYVPREGITPVRPSRFLADIPPSLFEEPLQDSRRRPERTAETETAGRCFSGAGKDEWPKAGDRVRHSIFGAGWVEERLDKEKVVIQFDVFGRKTLHLKYANLSRIQP